MKVFKIKKGLDIRLAGEAEKALSIVPHPDEVAIKPTDFIGILPRLLVSEGDKVKAGTPIFRDKKNEQIVFTAPVSGTIVRIVRGEKRILQEIVIAVDQQQEYVTFEKIAPSQISRSEIIERLLTSGAWAFIRQRPYDVIPNPAITPRDIYISCFDSAPLGPDYDFILHGKGHQFQAGLDILVKLTDGKVHLGVNADNVATKVITNSKNVEISHFSGPHPAGNVGVQIHQTKPINKGEVIWHINPQDVLAIGKLFTDGILDGNRIIAVSGSEIKHPKYWKTFVGGSIIGIVNENLNSENVRFISGNALTGTKIAQEGYLSFYHHQLTVIPEGNHYEFLGWALPGIEKYSKSRTFFSWLTPDKKYSIDTNYHGGERAFVLTGQYDEVFPFDIYPVLLLKSVLAEDIEKMENLGIYEVAEEDFALCEFVCSSKIESQSIIRKGLDLIRKEMS